MRSVGHQHSPPFLADVYHADVPCTHTLSGSVSLYLSHTILSAWGFSQHHLIQRGTFEREKETSTSCTTTMMTQTKQSKHVHMLVSQETPMCRMSLNEMLPLEN